MANDMVAAVANTLQTAEMQAKIKQALPENVSPARFTRVALMAMQQNPQLVEKDRTSFYNAIIKCAADGLVPDGREAALVPFKGAVQYMPMVGGIIKRLAQAGVIIDAQVVYKNDYFEQTLGDDAKIKHAAPPLGEPRGEPIGAYAIARLPNGMVMRDVMDHTEIEKARAVSQTGGKADGPWAMWWTEMARKTVTRRLAKRLPILDPGLRELVATDPDDPIPSTASTVEPAAPVPQIEAGQAGKRPKALAAIVAANAEEQLAPIEGERVPVEPPAPDDF